jgi:hypothetical protein
MVMNVRNDIFLPVECVVINMTTSHFYSVIKNAIVSIEEDLEKLEPSYIDSRNVKLCSYLGRWLGRFSKCYLRIQ